MPVSLPPRPDDAHKGTFGRVLIIAGSPGMSGAACLSGAAALRSGSGLVTVAVPKSIQSIVAAFEPSYTTVGLACDADEQLQIISDEELSSVLAGHIAGRDAVAIGPGLGQTRGAVQFVRAAVRQVDAPLILDADAISIVAADQISLNRAAPTILTPHPGEFGRLTNSTASAVRMDRMDRAQEFARGNGVVLVLKGHRTIITDGAQYCENPTGNSGMATGGSGDVLTGVIASLCGQKLDPFTAAVTGVYAHGLAGDLCATASSGRGMIASDLLHWLPAAWAKMEQ